MTPRTAGLWRGFTLLELSVVLTLIGVILGGGLVILTASVQSAAWNKTVARMDAIEKALLDYSVANNRIPCPSDLTIKPGTANYSVEAATPGTCYGGTPSANFKAASGTVEGGIPTRTLRLPDDYMYDMWGHRLRYAVDPTYTASNSLPVKASCSLTSAPDATAITVNDASGNPRTTNAAYAIVSHGGNGHGAYTSNGTVMSTGSVNTSEQTNCHCNSSGISTTYSPTYVEKYPTLDASNALDNFDDIVTFKDAWQLQAQNFPLNAAPNCNIYIYVADTSNNRIQKFNSSGSFLMGIGAGYNGVSGTIGSSGSGQGKFTNPTALAIDSSGNIFVTDYGNFRVEKFNSSGTWQTQFGNTCCAGDGEFQYNPTGLAIDSTGNIYAGDICSEASVNKYNNGGSFITQYVFGNTVFNCQNVGDGIGFLTMDSSGNIWATDTDNGGVHKINSAGSIVATIGAGGGTGKAKFNYLGGAALDSSGNLWIADQLNNRIQKLSSSGTWLQTIPSSCATSACTASTANGSFNQPAGITIDSSGNIWVADYGNNRMQEFSSSGTFLMAIGAGYNGVSGSIGSSGTAGGQFSNPSGIAISSR